MMAEFVQQVSKMVKDNIKGVHTALPRAPSYRSTPGLAWPRCSRP